MIAKRCRGLAAACVAAAALLTGCGSTGTSASDATASASGKPAICASADKLKQDVIGLKDVNVKADGASAVSAQLSKIQQQLTQVKRDAQGQYSAHTIALSNAMSGLQASLNAVKENVSGQTLSALASSVGTVVTAANNLVAAVSHTC